jgi:murein biosynthesis integral membrane protein MurJ
MPKHVSHIFKQVWQSATQQVITITGFGMLFALAVDLLIAARLGTTWVADALILALSIPRLIETAGREGTRFSLLSLFVETKQELCENEYHNFINGLFNLFVIISLGVVLIGWVFAPLIISTIGPGLTTEANAYAVQLFRLSLPLAFFAFSGTVLEALLNSQEYFVVVASRNILVAVTVVVATLLSWRSEETSVWIAAGYSLGYGCFFLWLLGHAFIRVGFRFSLRAWPDKKDFPRLRQAVIYPTVSLGIRQGSRVVERALASLIAPGGVAAYYFAFRIVSASQSIIGVSAATTSLPQITRLVIEGKKEAFIKMLQGKTKQVGLLSLPIALSLVIFYKPITQLLYGRGAFNASSIQQTGQLLQILGVAVVLLSIVPISSSSLYALQKYSWVFYDRVFESAINILLAWWLSRSMGLLGIAFAVPLSLAINLPILWYLNWVCIRQVTIIDSQKVEMLGP